MHGMKGHVHGLALLILAGACAPALAQTYSYAPARPVQWFIDLGPSITTGRTADFLDSGFTIGTGLTFRPDYRQPFSLRAEVNYSRFGATRRLLDEGSIANQTQIDDGSGQVVSGQLDGVLEAPISPWVRLYATAGIGLAWRRIELTQDVLVGDFFCDPWFGFCDIGFVNGRAVVASSETTRFAWNAGAGVNFDLPGGQAWFVEARYERIETQQPTEFVPIRVGFRF